MLIPVLFMCLLILIKTLTTKYESPDVAYYCGQAAPWFYDANVYSANQNDQMQITPYQCQFEPTQCSLDNYYQSGISIPSSLPNISPEYNVTGKYDTSQIYQQYGTYNKLFHF